LENHPDFPLKYFETSPFFLGIAWVLVKTKDLVDLAKYQGFFKTFVPSVLENHNFFIWNDIPSYMVRYTKNMWRY